MTHPGSRSRSSGTRKATTNLSRANDVLALVLVAIVLIAPVMAGSNRPVPWALWAIVVGLAGCSYFFVALRRAPNMELRFLQHRWITILGGVFLAYAALQIVPFGPLGTISIAPVPSALALMRLVTYALIFMLTIECCGNADRLRRMCLLIFFGIVLHAVWSLVALRLLGDVAIWGEKTAYLGFATGTFVNRNSFATFLGMGMILGIALWLGSALSSSRRHPSGRHKVEILSFDSLPLMGGIGIIALALMATASRLGIAAAIAGAMLTSVLVLAKIGVSRRRAMVIVGGLAFVLAVLAAISFGGQLSNRLVETLSGDNRMALWQQSLDLLMQNPLTGIGLDTYEFAFRAVQAPPLTPSVVWHSPHSTYLTLWIETGVIFGTIPLILCLLAARRAVEALRRRTDFVFAAATAIGITLQVAIHSVADFSLEIEAVTLLYVMLMALGASHMRKEPERIW